MRILILFICCMFYLLPAKAQFKVAEEEGQSWLQYFNQTRFNNRWGLWLDGGLRTRHDLVSGVSQLLIRPGVIYHANPNLRWVLCYAHFQHTQPFGESVRWQQEHRIWQGVFWQSPDKPIGFTWMQSARFEQRFRKNLVSRPEEADEYIFNYRIRYNLGFQYPLHKGLSAQVSNEVMFNFGKSIIYNHFDQNRFQAGLRCSINSHSSIFAGYLNVYQKRSVPNAVQMFHVLRISYFQNIDLRKKD